MYIIGFVLRIAIILGLALAPIVTSATETDETLPACSARPKYAPAVVERPTNRNRPFAFTPAAQRVSGPFGIDISRWDHPGNKLLDFDRIRQANFEFAIIKLSDGATSVSNRLAKRWWRVDRPAAEKAGFLVGGYHFAYPRGETATERRQDALNQARQAAREYGKWQPGRLPLVLDYEVLPTRKWTPREMTDWALTFLGEVENLIGAPPMIYSYANFFLKHMEPDLALARYPLWIAHYGVHLREPAPIAPWSLFDSYAIWQFSSSGRTPGTHRNIGDLNQAQPHWLAKLAGQASDHVWAEPLSDAQVAAFRSIAKGGTGERFHNRTGSARDGLTTWQTWISAPDKCSPNQPVNP